MLSYAFMQRAFVVAILLGVITPLVGVLVVFKRWSAVGDALSHSALAGVAIGLFLSMNPVWSATIFSVLCALALEGLRRLFPRYAELAISVITSLGVGLAAVFSGLSGGSRGFSDFLFGSIVAIADSEMLGIALLAALVLAFSLLLYRALFYIAFDEQGALLAGAPTGAINFLFTVLTAVTVSISARTVGSLVISSLLTLPVACAMQLSRSYRQNMILSVVFSLAFMIAGLTVAYYGGTKPGGSIVLLGVGTLLICIAAARIRDAWRRGRRGWDKA